MGTFRRCLQSRSNARVKDASKKLLDLMWVDTDKSAEPAHKIIRSRLCAREYETKKQSYIQRASVASQLFTAMPPLEAAKVHVSIMMSVGWSSKSKLLKLRDTTTATEHISKERPRDSDVFVSQKKIDWSTVNTKLASLSRSCTELKDASHIWQLNCVSLICGELGVFRRGKNNAALFHSAKMNVGMAVHGDDFVGL